MAPATSHHKFLKPFSAAISLQMGEKFAAKAIRYETLEYCELVPVRMCVRLYIEPDSVDQDLLARVVSTASNACRHLSSSTDIEILKAANYKNSDPKILRQLLLDYAGCSQANAPAYKLHPTDGPVVVNGLIAITLINADSIRF